jgi:hypothetical protein
VVVCRYRVEDFLLAFHDDALTDRVLHAYPPEGIAISLTFHRWRRQDVYAHIWSKDTVQVP